MSGDKLMQAVERAKSATLPFTKDEREAFIAICFTAMRLNPEFQNARTRLSFNDLRTMSVALANLMLRWQSEREPRKDAADLTAHKEALRASLAREAAMREALQKLDAAWTADFPNGPDTELLHGCKFSDDTLEIWRAARAALAGAQP